MAWERPCAATTQFKSYSQSKPAKVVHPARLKVVHSVTVSEQRCGCLAAVNDEFNCSIEHGKNENECHHITRRMTATTKAGIAHCWPLPCPKVLVLKQSGTSAMPITQLYSWYLYAPSIETNDLILQNNQLSFRIAGLLPVSSERHPAVSAAAGARMICDRVFARECWDGSP